MKAKATALLVGLSAAAFFSGAIPASAKGEHSSVGAMCILAIVSQVSTPEPRLNRPKTPMPCEACVLGGDAIVAAVRRLSGPNAAIFFTCKPVAREAQV